MPVVKQLSVTVANRPGQLARICETLAKNKINIIGLDASGAARQIRLMVSNAARAQRVLQKAGWRPKVENALVISAPDRPGSLGRVAAKLAKRGINVNYAYATVGGGAKRAAIVLGVANPARAAKVAR